MNKKPKRTADDIRSDVTSRIRAALDKGVIPWHKPWNSTENAPRNLQSGKAYRGINALLLSEFVSGYADPRWTTFAAAKKMGGLVRKGEKGNLVTLWKRIRVDDKDNPGDKKVIPILRYFIVFNVDQVEWPEGVLPARDLTEPIQQWEAMEAADKVLMDYIDSDAELSLHWGSDRAYYTPSFHSITLPDREQFHSQHGFYGTAFHEAAHSTAKGLGRDISGSFGSDPYGREELTAEITSCFICGETGVEGGFDNSVAYIQNWKKAIDADDNLILKAAGEAQKAADRILGTTFEEPKDETVIEEGAIHA